MHGPKETNLYDESHAILSLLIDILCYFKNQRRQTMVTTSEPLREVLEATGYLNDGTPAHGVLIGPEARSQSRTRDFTPDALWYSESSLTVYFKHERKTPSDEKVANWRREIWNQGFVPLLWVISPESVEIYNGFGLPKEFGDAAAHRLRTFERIAEELEKLDHFAGRLAMETGHFWQNESTVDRKTSVDQKLLSDLSTLERDLVSANLDHSCAQGLIGRSIFTQYLVDRKIVTSDILKRECGHEKLTAVLRDRNSTLQLYEWLREIFNGDMFPSDSILPPAEKHLHRVADFLDAVDPDTGQTTLFPYQFDVIPVELISSIYEQFAHSNSANAGAEIDVFYTRYSLVSLVLDEVMKELTGSETVLDLSCGSGVFLVDAFRRLTILQSGENGPSRETIRSTLHQQIFGVDISEPAVRVAAFSLYLAALELDPNPQPSEALKFEPLIGNTLIVGDAWTIDRNLEGDPRLIRDGVPKQFDLIVGNPPWSYRGIVARSKLNSIYGSKIPRSPRGVSLDFVNQALKFASNETRFGLVLSAVQFFGRSQSGQQVLRNLIEKLSPVTLVNLSNQTSWLFSRSNYPAMVLFARIPSIDNAEITTVQVPWSPNSAQTHTFEISRDDILTLPMVVWQKNTDYLKAAFFGLRRDLALLEKLTSEHLSLSNRLEEIHTKLKLGLKFGNRSQDSSYLHGLPFFTKDDLLSFSVPDDLATYDYDSAQRPRDRNIYRAPLLLVKENMTRIGRLSTTVSDRDIVFSDAFYGATMQHDIARISAAVLSSSLASWFLLMTASTIGLSKPRALLKDIEQIPIPKLESALDSKAGQRLLQLTYLLEISSPGDDNWLMLDDAVFDLYQLDEAERIVARDGLFRAKWQWKQGRIESAAATDLDPHICAYAKTFLDAVDLWLSVANRSRLRAEIFNFPTAAPLRVIRFVLEQDSGSSGTQVIQPEGNLRDVLNEIAQRLNVQLGKFLIGQRGLRIYGPDEVVIIKPSARRHWMRVSALEDADAVVADSVSGIFA